MNRLASRCFALLVSFSLTGLAAAAPVTFNFTFDASAVPPAGPGNRIGQPPAYHGVMASVPQGQSGARATGSITFESSLLANPGSNDFNLPDPAVLALNVTISGAASGNGTFTLADFQQVLFNTGGGTLNFSQQLVGQATDGSPWGSAGGCGGPFSGPGDAGDFNIFGATPSAPVGIDCFTLGAAGGNSDAMSLTSMTLGSAAVPTVTVAVPGLDAWGIAALAGLLAIAGIIALFCLRRPRSIPAGC